MGVRVLSAPERIDNWWGCRSEDVGYIPSLKIGVDVWETMPDGEAEAVEVIQSLVVGCGLSFAARASPPARRSASSSPLGGLRSGIARRRRLAIPSGSVATTAMLTCRIGGIYARNGAFVYPSWRHRRCPRESRSQRKKIGKASRRRRFGGCVVELRGGLTLLYGELLLRTGDKHSR